MPLSVRTGDAVTGPEYWCRRLGRLAAAFTCLVLTTCGGRPFQHEPFESVDFRSRAQTQTEGNVTVRASVPGPEETRRLFGVPLYDRGVQPVWIEVENKSPARLRLAQTGIDPAYFSPLEVAYVHRSGFSGQARAAMESYYHELAVGRFVQPGEKESGFVFTNARLGTKAFNVDLFGADRHDYSFTFFIDVPGFLPDHAEVDFAGLYSEAQVTDLDQAGLRAGLNSLPVYTTDAGGTGRGDPLNVVFVAYGQDLRAALIRSGWQETAASSESSKSPVGQMRYLFGRPADAVLLRARGKDDRNELRIWLAPMRADRRPVWLGQVIHQLPGLFRNLYQDPDIDEAQYYLLQTLWYGQSLAQVAWRAAFDPVPVSDTVLSFRRRGYFTRGYQIVVWPSGDPVSLLETARLVWDRPLER